MAIDKESNDQHKTEDLTGSSEGGTDMQPRGGGGKDDGSARVEGQEDPLRQDQKLIKK